MSAGAFEKADKKIQLKKRIQDLKQLNLFKANNGMKTDQAIAAGI